MAELHPAVYSILHDVLNFWPDVNDQQMIITCSPEFSTIIVVKTFHTIAMYNTLECFFSAPNFMLLNPSSVFCAPKTTVRSVCKLWYVKDTVTTKNRINVRKRNWTTICPYMMEKWQLDCNSAVVTDILLLSCTENVNLLFWDVVYVGVGKL